MRSARRAGCRRPGMMTIVGVAVVVVVVSRITPPPATLPEVVVFWFGAFGPSMRARQSALSFAGSALQRSIAFWRIEPLLSRRLRLRSSCAAPASLRQVARSSAVRPASQSARSFWYVDLAVGGGGIGAVHGRTRDSGGDADDDQSGERCEVS